MEFLLGFAIGVVATAVVAVFVYRNNKAKAAAALATASNVADKAVAVATTVAADVKK